jgi:hypothetical protein
MALNRKAFFAYPAEPTALRDVFNGLNDKITSIDIRLWENNDIAGRPFVDPIFQEIADSDFLIADITKLNFNVTLEIGFAIAKKKRCLLLKNATLKDDAELIAKIGIFDSLGYETYQNRNTLADLIYKFDSSIPLPVDHVKEGTAPVYLLETPTRNEAMITIASRLKKARLFYRSFNPDEHTRLGAIDAIEQVVRLTLAHETATTRKVGKARSDNRSPRYTTAIGTARAVQRTPSILDASRGCIRSQAVNCSRLLISTTGASCKSLVH